MGDDSPYLSATADLVADTAQIYEAGAVLLPALADVYVDLRGVVPGADAEYPFRRVGDIGLGDIGPAAELRSVLDRLDACLGQAQAAITRAGEAACYVARTFAETDDQARQQFDGIAGRLDRQGAAQAEDLAGNQLDNQIDVVDTDDVDGPEELTGDGER